MGVFPPTYFLRLHTRKALSFNCSFNHLIHNITSNQNRFVIHEQRREISLHWENRQFCETLAIYLSKWVIIHWTTVRSHYAASILFICALIKLFVIRCKFDPNFAIFQFAFDKTQYMKILIRRIRRMKLEWQSAPIFFLIKKINNWENSEGDCFSFLNVVSTIIINGTVKSLYSVFKY